MKKRDSMYPYLKDPRALAEIQKHKWFLSQESQCEVGFATAAVDWVKKYGDAWRRIHVKDDRGLESFVERRKYRRFNVAQEVTLRSKNIEFTAELINVNYFGVLCRTDHFLYLGNDVRIDVSLHEHEGCHIHCNGIVERFSSAALDGQCELFVRFDEQGQEQLERCYHLS
ncbi:MAG: PilZ domain-containing protein [Candidatus Omnitrophota bacterium]|nr:DUF4032 domain-containing protein [Candidatus Omnitrophota bacterium]